MASDGIERLTGELRTTEDEPVAEQVAVELDGMGGIHVAVFRLPRGAVGENQGLRLRVAGGRTIDLFILDGGIQGDGTVRAAVVTDSGHPGYGLGLEPSTSD